MVIRGLCRSAALLAPVLMLSASVTAPAQGESELSTSLATSIEKQFELPTAFQGSVNKLSPSLEPAVQTKQAGNQTESQTANILRQSDTLASEDDTLNDGRFFDVYAFTGRAGQDVTIYVESDDFDTYLLVIGPNGDAVAEVDDSNNSTNAATTLSLPNNGEYMVVATSYDSGVTGDYTVTVNTVLGTGDLQATLSWTSQDDLDLYVMDPSEEVVNFGTPRVASGGQLDVDANSQCAGLTNSPVENVYWPQGAAPTGEYRIGVSLYDRCTNTTEPIPFTLTLRVQGRVETLTGVVDENEDIVFFSTAVY